MADAVAVKFAGYAREWAGMAEETYRMAKALQAKWFAEGAGDHVPNDSTPMDDGVPGQPLVGSDVVAIMTRLGEIIAWGDGSGGAVIGTVYKASNIGIG